MKKHLLTLFLLCLCSMGMWAEPYAIRVNSTKDYPAEALADKDFQDRAQYVAHCVSLAAGDVVTCYDAGNNAEWVISAIDPYGEHEKFAASDKGIVCNTAGKYDVYIKLKYQDDLIYIGEGTNCTDNPDKEDDSDKDDDTDKDDDSAKPYQPADYSTSAPAECPAVMLQAFYWDSNQTGKLHGDTRWKTLAAQAGEIGAYFDMVWLPPSAKSSGGVGYHPKQYSNQNSDWGSRAELEQLMEILHNADTKVIADIVINHLDGMGWCEFFPQDFGAYGQFAPDASWICNGDEVNFDPGAGSCKGKATGPSDDGYGNESNYGAARDLAHNKAEVRDMCRAYLKWMKDEMKFDGWRYDYCKGFHGSHIDDYNKAAANYFSVTEYWDGNRDVLQHYLADAQWNTLTFDFATKYTAFNEGIASGNFSKCKGAGLPGVGKGRYAVTFIDSHDSYQRDNNEFCGAGNSMKYPDKILQANAFLLSMPGVPCVFYPHWVKFKKNIAPMVLARQATGVHSESRVEDEAGSGFYRATIYGKNGSIKLFLGPNSGYQNAPAGYTLADKGTNYAMYYQTNSAVAPRLIVTPGNTTFKDATKGITVTMQTVGGDAAKNKIYYTTDGSNPLTSDTKQVYTAPLTLKETTTVRAYAECDGAVTKVQTTTYTYKEPQTTPIIVRFYKPATWEKVYLYAWTKDAAGKVTEIMDKWPGTELTIPDETGYYYYQFDAKYKEVNFIFNGGNGKEQTSDLWTDEDVCYSWQGGGEKLEAECAVPSAVENIYANTTYSLTLYPNPVTDALYLTSSAALQSAYVYSITGQCMMNVQALATGSANGQEAMLDVHALPAGMYIVQTHATNGQQMTQRFIKQ